MSLSRKPLTILLFSLIIVLTDGCGGTVDNKGSKTCSNRQADLEDQIRNSLDATTADTPYSISIQSEDGRRFEYVTPGFTPETPFRSASTSKMVAAAVILDLVQNNRLSLDDHPQAYIDWWPSTGTLSTITLKDLLSFTSGLSEQPLCLNFGIYDFEACVKNIADKNSNAPQPGTEFYYGPNHLQVAGLMAAKASGLQDWHSVFNAFKSKTGLFSHSDFNLPSEKNPRIAGGMTVIGKDYLNFLEQLYHEKLLSHSLTMMMTNDQRSEAASVNSPAIDGLDEDWHYGFGTWIESQSNPYDSDRTTGRVSSMGLYGAYPFLDWKHHYFGIVAREGNFTSFTQGYKLFLTVAPMFEQWAAPCSQ